MVLLAQLLVTDGGLLQRRSSGPLARPGGQTLSKPRATRARRGSRAISTQLCRLLATLPYHRAPARQRPRALASHRAGLLHCGLHGTSEGHAVHSPSPVSPSHLLLKGYACTCTPSLRGKAPGPRADMALRVCWICGCQEDRIRLGANDTRPSCMNVRGLPCQYDGRDSLSPYSPASHSVAAPLDRLYTAAGTGSSQAQQPATPGLRVARGMSGDGQVIRPESSAGARAQVSHNGAGWLEQSDPLASGSNSGALPGGRPTSDGGAGSGAGAGVPIELRPWACRRARQRAAAARRQQASAPRDAADHPISTPKAASPTLADVGGTSPGPTRASPSAYASASTPTRPGAAYPMEVIAVPREGQEALLMRPCIDCGRRTGSFCDWCLAADRLPDEEWVTGQHTPLCTVCDRQHDRCHRCRGLIWATPPPHGA